MTRNLTLLIDGTEVTVTVSRDGDLIVVERDGQRHEVLVVADRVVAAAGGAVASPAPGTAAATPAGPAPVAAGVRSTGAGSNRTGDVRAPMVGVVREIHVKQGAPVTEGERVITMEAMKMEIYVVAPISGNVASFTCAPGDTVQDGAVVATITPASGASAR